MSKQQLEIGLRNGRRRKATGGQALPLSHRSVRTPLDSPKKSNAERRGRKDPAKGSLATTLKEHGQVLASEAGSSSVELPHADSPFGSLVSRLISRRVGGSGIPRERIMAAISAATAASSASSRPVSMAQGGVQPAGANLNPVYVLLVNRVTGGFLDTEYGLVRSLGPVGYLNHHFGLSANDDTAVNDFFSSVPDVIANPFAPNSPTFQQIWDGILTGTALELYQLEADALPDLLPNGVAFTGFLQGATIGRAILSRRMLLERMTEFWTDHFNIDIFTTWQGWLKPVDDRVVIRTNALGSFHTMVDESMHSSAMMVYLDQFTSSDPNPNENYARELLELHTVGEGQGYNEDDIRDVADLLTGFSVSFTDLGFQFKSSQHVEGPSGGYSILKLDPNPILIPQDLLTSPTKGQQEGEDLLAGLQTHPRTAAYIASKMLRFMLRYEPTQQQLEDVARVYRNSNGNSEAMIREILKPANLNSLLATSPTTLKVKRPFQLATTFLRSVGGVPQWSTTQGTGIEDAGTGYAVGDLLTVQGGTLESGSSESVFEVLDIDPSGGVTSAKLSFEGDYQTLPPHPSPTTTTGSGTGCTLNVYPTVVNPFDNMVARLKILSNAPFEWGPPDGYPDAEQAWIGNLLGRWDLLGDLVRNEVPGIYVDQDALVNKLLGVPGAEVGAFLNRLMAGGALTAEEETLIQIYFNILVILATAPAGGPFYLPPEEYGLAVAELFALVASAPSYQYY